MRAPWVHLLLTTVLTSCAADSVDELDGAVDITGKADGPSVDGLYQLGAATAYKGDLRALQLNSDGTYVRLRCYTINCTETLPETNHYRVFENTTTHKQYVAFEGFERDDPMTTDTHQVTVDVYEIKKTGADLQLRKTHTARWVTLSATTDEAVCTASGGTWKPTEDLDGAAAGTTTHCDCGQDPNKWPSPAFVPGAGGCRTTYAIGEDACDTTLGLYTDDDRDALGDYCLCPAATRPTDDGCVAF